MRGTYDSYVRERKPFCHPDKDYYAFGKCRVCYDASRYVAHPRQVMKAECHPEQEHYGNNLCKKCYLKRWHQEHPGKAWAYSRAKHMLQLYGITPEQYDEMLNKQRGVCALCERPPKNYRLAVDHDHQNGKVRGLLCGHCNRILGWLETRPSFGRKLAWYFL